MQEASEDSHANAQTSGGRFIDTLITQWTKRTGSEIALHQAEELNPTKRATECSTAPEGKLQILQNQERIIQVLKGRLRKSQETEASLSASLETEMRNKEEIQTKLNATWESIDTITEYFNYISESLASFQQHRANLSALYDNVILKQQESTQKLQLDITKSKDLEQHVARLENKSLLQEESLREATSEQSKLRKQIESLTYEVQSQKELANAYAEEKLTLVKEQQKLLLEYENLQSQLRTIEKEKCDVAMLTAQLEDKLLSQQQKLQETLTERNNLRNQLQDTESAFHLQNNNLANAYAEEKKTLVEQQQRLTIECEDLQSRLNTLEQEKNKLIETVAQKDAVLSQLQNKYKSKFQELTENNENTNVKCETLKNQQKILETELRKKMEMINNLEMTLNMTKQREVGLINDVNRLEKSLISEMDCSKNLKIKLLDTEKNLKVMQKQKAELQETLEIAKSANEIVNSELQNQQKIFQNEKDEIEKRENMRIKNTEILYENMQARNAKEVLVLQSGYEARLLELKRTIESLNEKANNIKKENNALNMSLKDMKVENNDLKNNYRMVMERNDKLEEKLKEGTKMMKSNPTSIEDRQSNDNVAQKQINAKRKNKVCFDLEITEILNNNNNNAVSTSADFSDDEQNNSLTWPLKREYPTERESQKEQEAEVTSAGRKFFKSRSAQPRVYSKRRQNS